MSCLFNSLAPAVSLNPEILRQTIAAYLKTDPKLLDNINAKDIVEWVEGRTLEEYANRMAQSGWGGAIEIRAFCELYDMNVVVHVLYTGKEFTVKTSKKPTRVMHISYTGNHFEPLYIEFKA